jgi:hypothetical protein
MLSRAERVGSIRSASGETSQQARSSNRRTAGAELYPTLLDQHLKATAGLSSQDVATSSAITPLG